MIDINTALQNIYRLFFPKRCLKAFKFYIKDGIIFWGFKFPYFFLSKLNNKIIIEDGFIKSVTGAEILSIVKDKLGIYYNAKTKSSFEDLVLNTSIDDGVDISKFIINYRQKCISKYNAAREYTIDLDSKYILLIDQIFGDLSVKYGLSDSSSFEEMLLSALNDYPKHKIIIKIHPDVYTKRKRGYYDVELLEKNPRIRIISQNYHPIRLIREADAVYTVTSQVGFEALIWGKKVKCFGMPFYAGWGLTEDVLQVPERRKNVCLEKLVYAALFKYSIYRDPETSKLTTPEKTIEYIDFQRQMRFRFPEKIYAYGFTPWKRPILKSFTQGSDLIFVDCLKDVPSSATMLVWGSLKCEKLDESVKLVRVEDGFLRSVGLGGDFIRPQSWVFDDIGIYYDSSKLSRLEVILNDAKFKVEELSRAADLIQKLIKEKISKYNLGGHSQNIDIEGKINILVVGQVENDASIRFGTGEINTNLKLLKKVRADFPSACIIYKPHPDVVAGIRKKGEDEALEKDYYDLRVNSGDALSVFKYVDSVHTMTSLVGFEALLRKKKVFTYGQPFYAGWGLTTDQMPFDRRNRKLSLEELVAGSLIRYPTYLSFVTNMYTSPERVVSELIQKKNKGVKRMPLWRKFIRDLVKIWTHSNLRSNA